MSFTGDPETFWLNTTNIVLGIVTVICLLVVGRAIFQEVFARIRHRALATADDHAYVEQELGIVMADGGEPIHRPRGNDESHIVRSEN